MRHYCGLINQSLLGQELRVYGWVHKRRDHGGVIFIDLRDREGMVQVVCSPQQAQVFAIAETLRNEYVVEISGLVRKRPEGTINTSLATGELEILAKNIHIL